MYGQISALGSCTTEPNLQLPSMFYLQTVTLNPVCQYILPKVGRHIPILLSYLIFSPDNLEPVTKQPRYPSLHNTLSFDFFYPLFSSSKHPKMFRRKWSGLPADPEFPIDLKELG